MTSATPRAVSKVGFGRFSVCLVLLFGMPGILSAGSTKYWKGPSGGNWSEPSYWSGSSVPESDDEVWITNTVATTVNIDGDVTVVSVRIGHKDNRLTGPAGGITFTGTGKLTCTAATTLHVMDYQSLTFDGPGYAGNACNIGTGAEPSGAVASLTVTGGSEFYIGSYFMSGSTNDVANFTLADGKVSIPYFQKFSAGSRITMTGGELEIRKAGNQFPSSPDAVVDITGGTVFVDRLSDTRLLPKGTARLIDRGDVYNSVPISAAAELGGFLYVTNAPEAGVSFAAGQSLGGRGEVYAGQLRFPKAARTDIDVSRVCLSLQLYPVESKSTARLDVWNAIEFGAFGDWDSAGRAATVNWHGPVTVNTTDCFDGTTARTITLDNVYPCPGASFAVSGAGTANLVLADGTIRYRLDALSVAAGATLNGPDALLRTDAFTMAANSRLVLAAGRGIDAFTAAVDPSATIEARLPDSPEEGQIYPVLTLPPDADAPDIGVVTLANPSGDWRVARFGSTIALTDGKIPEAVEDTEWTGAVDEKWSTVGNWKGGEVPPGGKTSTIIYLSGTNHTAEMNYDVSLSKFASLVFRNGGPFEMDGNAISWFNSYDYTASSAAILSSANLPVVIRNDISRFQSARACVFSAGDSYIELDGTLSANLTDHFIVGGDVRIGGTANLNSLSCVSGKTRPSELTILEGGSVVCANQISVLPVKGSTYMYNVPLDIRQGGTLTVSGGGMMYRSTVENRVDGLFDCRVPLWLTNDVSVTMRGTGTLVLASVRSTPSAKGNTTLTVGGGLTVRPASWTTVTANAPDRCISLAVETTATLGATNDWTYGVAEGVETTTAAADRALGLTSALSVLTVDTADPGDATRGHAITFADPVVGPGTVRKTGAGTLLLASDANGFGAADVRKGVFAWTCDQTIPKLSAAQGATLAFGAVDGVPARLTVSSDLDLSGVSVQPFDATAGDALANGYATVIEGVGGARLSGLPTAGRFKFRIVGGSRLQAKAVSGMLLIVR